MLYLATTRLSEFWPAGRPLTFLGKWCIPEDEVDCGVAVEAHNILPYPWDDGEKFQRAADYIFRVYERLLAQLANTLNQVHDLDKSIRYWRIIAGPWLSYYVEAFYDRYACLKEALERDPNLVTVGLDSSSFLIPRTFGEFVDLYVGDEYNLQLYTQILRAMGVNVPTKALARMMKPAAERTNHFRGFYRTSDRFVRRLGSSLFEFAVRHSKVGMIGTGVGVTDGLKLFVSSGLRIACCNEFADWQAALEDDINPDMRKMLREILQPEDDFERIVFPSVADNMPKAHLEGFALRRAYALGRFGRLRRSAAPKVLVSSYGWYGDETSRIYAAEAQDQGSKLIATQHGGHYGILRFMSPEVHEQKIGDKFYTWGWIDGLGCEGNVEPMPGLKLGKLKRLEIRRKKTTRKQGFVLVTTAHPRYLYRFQSHPVGPQWAQYFQWALRFAGNIREEIRRQLKVRLYFESYGWPIERWWHSSFPDIVLDHGAKIEKHFVTARMLILDHPSTALSEAFVLDIPTLLFWNSSRYLLRPSAQPYFDHLQRVGILHETPESAAAALNEIFENPESWWEQSVLQKAKNEFCHQFARASMDWLEKWKAVLLHHGA